MNFLEQKSARAYEEKKAFIKINQYTQKQITIFIALNKEN